ISQVVLLQRPDYYKSCTPLTVSKSYFMEENFYEQAPTLPSAIAAEVPLFEAVSPSMRGVEAVVRELAHSSVPVLLIGERGTGKRTIAGKIHSNSTHIREGLRVATCLGLVPETLGAHVLRSGTTLYLDEIGDLS